MHFTFALYLYKGLQWCGGGKNITFSVWPKLAKITFNNCSKLHYNVKGNDEF